MIELYVHSPPPNSSSEDNLTFYKKKINLPFARKFCVLSNFNSNANSVGALLIAVKHNSQMKMDWVRSGVLTANSVKSSWGGGGYISSFLVLRDGFLLGLFFNREDGGDMIPAISANFRWAMRRYVLKQ
jgi:hypothetical protein